MCCGARCRRPGNCALRRMRRREGKGAARRVGSDKEAKRQVPLGGSEEPATIDTEDGLGGSSREGPPAAGRRKGAEKRRRKRRYGKEKTKKGRRKRRRRKRNVGSRGRSPGDASFRVLTANPVAARRNAPPSENGPVAPPGASLEIVCSGKLGRAWDWREH